MDKQFNLKDIALIGRTFEEYYNMFDMKDLSGNEIILDVAALEYARDILYRREIGQVGRKDKHYIPDPSKENVI